MSYNGKKRQKNKVTENPVPINIYDTSIDIVTDYSLDKPLGPGEGSSLNWHVIKITLGSQLKGESRSRKPILLKLSFHGL